MSIGKFDETNESNNEASEAKEQTENIDKPRNQILETPDSYKDNFNKKLDTNDAEKNKESAGKLDQEKQTDKNQDSEKTSFLEKMKNLLSHKESGEKNTGDSEKGESAIETKKQQHDSFVDKYKVADGVDETVNKNEKVDKPSEGSGDEGEEKQHGDGGEKTPWSDRVQNKEDEKKKQDDELEI